MDDFGDLYADLEDNGIAEISAIKESDDGIDDANGKAAPVSGAEDENMITECSNSSDSEDDLHIVLNDEDCRKFRPPQRVDLGNVGVVAGWSDEDDEGDLVLVGNTDRLSKDQKCAGQLPQQPNGLAQGGAERGSVAKTGYRNWHVGSHLVGFPSNARTSMSGRDDWDHVMAPCSGGTASSNSSIPTVAGFFLPRNRTIFDIDIEEFEQKPWKHHGVDITDYFNFDLDEESWKSYCKRMDHFRQQARIFRFPIHEPSRLNQVLESEMVSNKSLPSEVMQGGRRERFSSTHEKPRGRAIQVEGGFAERIPSTDIRRPRLWDSDVVIQIAMEDSIGNASVPCEEEQQHVEQGHTYGSVFKSENELHNSLSLGHDGQRVKKIANPVEHHYPENRTISPSGATVEVKAKLDCKKGDSVDPSTAAASMLLDDTASCDQVLHNSSLSDLESHSKASRDGISLAKVLSPDRKTSLSSVSGLQESIKSDIYFSNDSGSDGTRVEHESSEDCNHNCSLSIGDKKCCGRTRLQDRAEMSVRADSKKASVRAYRKCRNVSDTIEVSYGTRTRRSDYGIAAGGHLSSYEEESEVPRSYKSRRDAENHVGEKPYASNFYKKGYHDTCNLRNQDERDCLLKQRVATRDNVNKQRECYIRERYHDDHGMRPVACKDSNRSISKSKSLLKEKNSCLQQKMENKNERWHMDSEYDDIVCEERNQEKYVQEMHRRHIPYYDSEEIFKHEFGRRMSHSVRELRSPDRRSKYDTDSCFDLNRSRRYFGNDVKNWRYLDHSLLDSKIYRESPVAGERGWLDANSPTNYLPISCRSSKKHVDHRRLPNIKEIQSKNVKDECYFVAGSKVRHHSLYENTLDFEIDDHFVEERDLYVDNIVSIQKREFDWLAKQRISTDEIKFRHQQWDGPSSPEGSSLRGRSSRHEKRRSVIQQSGSGRKFSDDHVLNSTRKKTISERCSYTDSRDHIGVVSHIFQKGRHEQVAVERIEAVNMHVNGWKGKFPKRSNEVLQGSEGQNGTDRMISKKLKEAAYIEEVNTWREVPPRSLKAEGIRTRPASLQVERVKDCYDKNPIPQDNEDDEIEEGQLIEEPDGRDLVPVTKDRSSDKKATHRAAEASWTNRAEQKNRQTEDPGCGNKIAGVSGSNRILETLARMEKRRERFKDPIAPKPAAPEILPSPRLEVAVATEVVEQQRPARKRRWGGQLESTENST